MDMLKEGFVNDTAEVRSCAMKYISSFMKIGSDIQRFLGMAHV
jgi:hypothetical protein